MKTDPRYGYFPRWPQDGDSWIHPEDLVVAQRLVPSMRIWRRDGTRGRFAILHYGDIRIRVVPTLWNEIVGSEIATEGIEVGVWVEILSRMQRNTYRIGKIREMFWDSRTGTIRYRIEHNQKPLPNFFGRDDLRPIRPISTRHGSDMAFSR